MNTLALFLLAFLTAGQSNAFAAENEFKNEIEGSTSAELIFSNLGNTSTANTTTIQAHLGYSYLIRSPFQLSSDFEVFHKYSETKWQAHFGPTFNFLGHSIEDSCFLSALFGVSHISPEYTEYTEFERSTGLYTFSMVLRAGVRVPITAQLSWKPTAQYYWQAADSDSSWIYAGFARDSLSIIPLSFAFVF